MKVFISADIEGVTGVTHWDETDKQKEVFREFQQQMTAEVAAACEGALLAGASEIWVKDAHHTARNLLASQLPRETHLVRGWSDHPFSMVQELDQSFHALLMIGYHAGAGSGANPLAHTLTQTVAALDINGQKVSEMILHAYAAAFVGVPLVCVTGDARICNDAEVLVPGIQTVAVKQGIGGSTVSIHPQLAIEKIRQGVQTALAGKVTRYRLTLPPRFEVEIEFREHAKAFRASFYPRAQLKGPNVIRFETDDYFEVLRLILFTIL